MGEDAATGRVCAPADVAGKKIKDVMADSSLVSSPKFAKATTNAAKVKGSWEACEYSCDKADATTGNQQFSHVSGGMPLCTLEDALSATHQFGLFVRRHWLHIG